VFCLGDSVSRESACAFGLTEPNLSGSSVIYKIRLLKNRDHSYKFSEPSKFGIIYFGSVLDIQAYK
jgi:hypothetical protein